MKTFKCLLAVFALLLQLSDVRARPRGSVPQTTFNGGAVQVGVRFLPEHSAYPFVDMAKGGTTIKDSTGAVAAPSTLDANGYPTSGIWSKTLSWPRPEQKSGDYLMMWTGGGPNTVMRSPGGTFVSGSLNGANGTYRFVPTPTGHQAASTATIGVATTGSSYSPVTSLAIVNVNDLAAWQANPNAYASEYIAAYAAGKFGAVRFLDWSGSDFAGGNSSTWTDWASRKPLNYNNFSGEEFRANWWAGSPTNGGSGNDYTLTTPAAPGYIFGNGAPVDKQIMHVQFQDNATLIQSTTVTFTGNTVNWSGHTFTGNEPISLYKTAANLPTGLWSSQNYYVVTSSIVAGVSFQVSLTPGGAAIGSFGTGASGNYGGVRLPTLNINSSGAVPIRNVYGDPLTSSSELPNNGGATAVYGTLIMDSVMNCWMKNGGATGAGSRGIQNGVPPELQLSLAIQTRQHPWFVSSAYALDPITDFWPTFAAYVKANGPAWMIPRYEPVNELWNFQSGFYGTRYAWNKSWHHWALQFDVKAWQGMTSSKLGQALQAVYGGVPDATKYWLVNGSQTTSAYSGSGLSITFENNERMTAAHYVSSGPAQSGYTQTAASKYVTHSAPANYITPLWINTLQELQTAILYTATNLNNSAAQTANLNSYVDTLNGATVSGTGIFSLGSPGVLNWTAHGRSTGDRIVVYTNGSLFTGLTQRIVYWVTVVDADHLNLSASNGGALINFTGSQSGTHTATQVFTSGFNANMVVAQAQAFKNWAAGFTNDAGNPIGLTFYEGGLSMNADLVQAGSTTISAATNATNCVVTVAATTTLPAGGSAVSGVAAQVGGAISFSSVGGMTQLNTSTFGVTFAAGGSANIAGANSLILNQAVGFEQLGGQDFRLPSELVSGAPYYVVSAGNPFQISATRGGAAITFAGDANTFGVTATPGWFVTNIAGQNLTLDVDSSGFGAYTSGGTLTYSNSLRQVYNLRAASRLAPNLEGITYGNTLPIPSVFSQIAAMGGQFPSKFNLNVIGDVPWGVLQPNIFPPYPTTGEIIGIKNFSPGYN